MTGDPAGHQERQPIGGIKVSSELAGFTYRRQPEEPCLLSSALTEIAQREINIHGLSLASFHDEVIASFTTDVAHGPAVHSILLRSVVDSARLTHDSSAVNVSLFPHRNDISLFGRTIAASGCQSTSGTHIISSISGLTVTSSQAQLEETLASLLTFVELPENHAPLAPQSILVNMIETVAVYHEKVIRVYGFDRVTDLALIEMRFSAKEAEYWGQQLITLGVAGCRFRQVMFQQDSAGTCRCLLLLDRDNADNFCRSLEKSVQSGYTLTIGLTEPVELLCFHGPHFQDRPGIVDTLFRCLGKGGVPHLSHIPHLIGCSGTSIYLIVGDGEADKVKGLLDADFIVP